MTKRTRLFLAGASGILVLGLGTGLVAAYVGGFQDLTLVGGGGAGGLAYVPADARIIAYADVRDVMDSDVRRKLSGFQQGADDGAARFKEESGIDLQTDIHDVVAWVTGMGEATLAQPPLVLTNCRFDAVRIEGLILEQGGIVEDYK